MAIEVRQMTVKSIVARDGEADPAKAHLDAEKLKEEVLAECQQMILEMLRMERER